MLQPLAGEPSEAVRGPRSVVLVVDDDPGVRASFRLILEEEYDVLEARDGVQALETLRADPVDLVLLDVRLPGMDGLQVLERIRSLDERLDVILVTAVKTVKTAVDAMKLGALDYLTKPFDQEEVLPLIRRAVEKRTLEREVVALRSELARREGPEALVGQSPEMRKLFQVVDQVARTTATVLITGESGTGKELIARAIHRRSPRRDRPFVAVNPAAIAESLLESELFGHERGAFTGAYQRKLGKFELAQGGTLFLDEIATLRAEAQAKLLRALQEREIERVGGTRSIKVDVRIIAATNADLRKAIAAGAFREDLYYRLNVVPLVAPPLRGRPGDVPLLVTHFIRRYSREFNKPVTALSPEAQTALEGYGWPGNVRELQNVIERSVALAEGPVIQLRDLPLDLMLPDHGARSRETESLPLPEACERFERQIVLRVLERAGWNHTEAARLLGIHRNTLQLKVAKWSLRRPGSEA
ncbi:MAG: sigma-54-dependent Fis family transcriptional regulator [Candidatus Rokubacteria bacterium]|nr:sigma-54-dependent Fis family transcriptional regulator [Candidatus Rokubacteria bacterium]